ncbi:hypothetical protein CBOM_06871 [Ceraceosorus bombacis]|uniref:Uncharacterized protein n=1 Tax=Ceraceosorus bombacis TaxID=401625 RepID=A0A0N7LBJ5_9BASI|nr:hypothetical protein CBOM_06871 [Ceraceosorus bombacis]
MSTAKSTDDKRLVDAEHANAHLTLLCEHHSFLYFQLVQEPGAHPSNRTGCTPFLHLFPSPPLSHPCFLDQHRMTQFARVFLLLLPLVQLACSVPLGNSLNERRQTSGGAAAASPFQGNARFSSSSTSNFPQAPPLPPLRALNTRPATSSATSDEDASDAQTTTPAAGDGVDSASSSSSTVQDDVTSTVDESVQPTSNSRVLTATAQAADANSELQWVPSADANQAEQDDTSNSASSASSDDASASDDDESSDSAASSANQLDSTDSDSTDSASTPACGAATQQLSSAQAKKLIAQAVSSVTAAMASATATATHTFDDGMWHPATSSAIPSATSDASLKFKSNSEDAQEDASASDEVGDEGMQDVTSADSAASDAQDSSADESDTSLERRSIYHTHHGKDKKRVDNSAKVTPSASSTKSKKGRKSKKGKKSKSKGKGKSKSKKQKSSKKRALQIVVAGPYRKRSLVVTGSDGASISLVGGDADLLQANIKSSNGALIHLKSRAHSHSHEHDHEHEHAHVHSHIHSHGHYHRRDLGAGLTSLVGQLGVLQPLDGAMSGTGLSQLVANLVLAPLQAVGSAATSALGGSISPGRFATGPADPNRPSPNHSSATNSTSASAPPVFMLSPSTSSSGVKLQLIEMADSDGGSGANVGWKQVELQATLTTAPANEPHLYCATIRKPASLRMEICDDEASKTTADGSAPDDQAASRRFLYDPTTGEVVPASAASASTTPAAPSASSSGAASSSTSLSPASTSTSGTGAPAQVASMPVPPAPKAAPSRRGLGAANLGDNPSDANQSTQVKLVFFVDAPKGADASAAQAAQDGAPSSDTQSADSSSSAASPSDAALRPALVSDAQDDAADAHDEATDADVAGDSDGNTMPGDDASSDAPADSDTGDSRFASDSAVMDSSDDAQDQDSTDADEEDQSSGYSASSSAPASATATITGTSLTGTSGSASATQAATTATSSTVAGVTGVPLLSAQMATTLYPQPSAAPAPTASAGNA